MTQLEKLENAISEETAVRLHLGAMTALSTVRQKVDWKLTRFP